MRPGGTAFDLVMNVEESLALAVLDFVGIEYGESASASIAGAGGPLTEQGATRERCGQEAFSVRKVSTPSTTCRWLASTSG